MPPPPSSRPHSASILSPFGKKRLDGQTTKPRPFADSTNLIHTALDVLMPYGPARRHNHRHGFAMPRDRDLLSRFNLVQQIGEMGLGLERTDFSHKGRLERKT